MASMEQTIPEKIVTMGKKINQTNQESLTFLSKISNILDVAKKPNPDLLFVTLIRYAIKYFVYYCAYWWPLPAVTFDQVKWWKVLRMNSVIVETLLD